MQVKINSVIGGGKFENGAITAAYGYLFNACAAAHDGCGKRFINSRPAGQNGPSITFANDDSNGGNPNLPVSNATADMIEKAVVASKVDGININSSTGGIHAAGSAHFVGRAVDVNSINGVAVSNSSNFGNVQALQSALAVQPNIRENFGPAMVTKTFSDGSTNQVPSQALAHRNHIHASGQQ